MRPDQLDRRERQRTELARHQGLERRRRYDHARELDELERAREIRRVRLRRAADAATVADWIDRFTNARRSANA